MRELIGRPEVLPKDFYVYVHRRASDRENGRYGTGSVAYVGKGFGARAWDKTSRGRHWHFSFKKHGFDVEVVQDGLAEWYALDLEVALIAKYGRANLANMTDGGDGVSGYVFTDADKAKMRARTLARYDDPAEREAMSREVKARYQNDPGLRARMGKKVVEAWNDPNSGMRNRQKPVICVETGRLFQSGAEAMLWLQTIGFKSDRASNVYACCKGRIAKAHGHTWKYADHDLHALQAETIRLREAKKAANLIAGAKKRSESLRQKYSDPLHKAELAERGAKGRAARAASPGFERAQGDAIRRAWADPNSALHKRKKQVVCVETGAIFQSGRDASNWVKTVTEVKSGRPNGIYDCLVGKKPSAYGYTWAYA